MKFSIALALQFIAANAVPVVTREETPSSFPNFEYSYDGQQCSEYRDKDLTQIPQECIYDVVCNQSSADAVETCFGPGHEPRGKITVGDLQALSPYCKQQAICGFFGSAKTQSKSKRHSEISLEHDIGKPQPDQFNTDEVEIFDPNQFAFLGNDIPKHPPQENWNSEDVETEIPLENDIATTPPQENWNSEDVDLINESQFFKE